jgi:hypothetical protein
MSSVDLRSEQHNDQRIVQRLREPQQRPTADVFGLGLMERRPELAQPSRDSTRSRLFSSAGFPIRNAGFASIQSRSPCGTKTRR